MKKLLAAAALLTAPLALQADQPLPPSAARQGDFMAFQIMTTNPDALMKEWAKPTPGVQLETQHTTTLNQPIHTFVAFAGCKPDADGSCHVTARFVVTDPDGQPYDQTDGVALLNGPPPPKGNFAMGNASLGIKVEPGEALGKYTITVETTDKVAGITVKTTDSFTVTEAPRVGGWQKVLNPDSAAELRGPVKAMLAKISNKKLKVAKIESAEKQVVAGTNYRLRLRLKDGSRWQAVVWRKLDGTYKVRELGEIAG